MKTLTQAAQAKLAQPTATLFNAARVEWGGAVGTRWYSDAERSVDGVPMEGRVTSWGAMRSRLGGRPGAWTLELSDEDESILAIVRQEGAEAKRVTVFYAWPGAAQADWVVVFGGATATPPRRDSAAGRIVLPVLPLDAMHDAPALDKIEDAAFPSCTPEFRGRCLPMVYGYRQMVEAVPADGFGPRAELAARFDWHDTSFFVADASAFPASDAQNPIRVWVGGEMVEGYFAENAFTVTQRPIVLRSGAQLTARGSRPNGPFQEFGLDADEATGHWVGDAIRFRAIDFAADPPEPVGPHQYRRILQHRRVGASESVVSLEQPFAAGFPWMEYIPRYLTRTGFASWLPPEEYAEEAFECEITTSREMHDRGEPVTWAGESTCTCTW